jgi:hypothetical protein
MAVPLALLVTIFILLFLNILITYAISYLPHGLRSKEKNEEPLDYVNGESNDVTVKIVISFIYALKLLYLSLAQKSLELFGMH